MSASTGTGVPRPSGEERAQRLEATVQPFISKLEGLGESVLYQRPAEGEWSVMMIAAHVAEMLPYWSRQATEVVGRAENNQPFGRTHEDPDRVGAVERHANDRLAEVLPRLRDGLAEAAAALRAIPADGWRRTARHSRRGEMSVAEFVDAFLIDHAAEHLGQVDATLAAVRR